MGTITIVKRSNGKIIDRVTSNTVVSKPVVEETPAVPEQEQETKYSEEYLESLSFNDLKEIGKSEFDVTHRSTVGLIEEILEAQAAQDENNNKTPEEG